MQADLFCSPGPWRGHLDVAARPRSGDWYDDEGSTWRQAGIDLVLSLLEIDEAAELGLGEEPQAAENHGIGFISFQYPTAVSRHPGKRLWRQSNMSQDTSMRVRTSRCIVAGVSAGPAWLQPRC
jgi:hypothetical protein